MNTINRFEIDTDIDYSGDPESSRRQGAIFCFDSQQEEVDDDLHFLELDKLPGPIHVDRLVVRGWRYAFLRSEIASSPSPILDNPQPPHENTGMNRLDENERTHPNFFGMKLILIKPIEPNGPHQIAQYAICHADGGKQEIIEGDYADEQESVEPVNVYEMGSIFDGPGTSGFPKSSVSPEEADAIAAFYDQIHGELVDTIIDAVDSGKI